MEGSLQLDRLKRKSKGGSLAAKQAWDRNLESVLHPFLCTSQPRHKDKTNPPLELSPENPVATKRSIIHSLKEKSVPTFIALRNFDTFKTP